MTGNTELTADTRDRGSVRAFEPRIEREYATGRERWVCRGRLRLTQPGYRGSTTRQCRATLQPDWTWCPRCGGLLAWDGSATYGETELRHLERTTA